MIAMHKNGWIHFTRETEEWWFKINDIAAFHTMGENGKPVAWNEYWFASIHLKGLHDGKEIPLYKDEFEAFRRKIIASDENIENGPRPRNTAVVDAG